MNAREILRRMCAAMRGTRHQENGNDAARMQRTLTIIFEDRASTRPQLCAVPCTTGQRASRMYHRTGRT